MEGLKIVFILYTIVVFIIGCLFGYVIKMKEQNKDKKIVKTEIQPQKVNLVAPQPRNIDSAAPQPIPDYKVDTPCNYCEQTSIKCANCRDAGDYRVFYNYFGWPNIEEIGDGRYRKC